MKSVFQKKYVEPIAELELFSSDFADVLVISDDDNNVDDPFGN